MFEITIFFLIASLFSVFTGRFLLSTLGIKLNKNQFSYSEQGFFGLILLSFIALLLNFFYPIDSNIASFALLIPFFQIFFEFKKLNNKLIKQIFFHSLIISIVCFIFISFDNVNRPDAGIYHLPYIKILNEFKIFSGVVSLNPVFGATSIIQYTSAIFNNFLFKDVGITIPLALLAIYLIEYFVKQFFLKNNDTSYRLLLFLIITYIFLEMNRYSEYGNDNPAHLSLFYFVSLIFRKEFSLKIDKNFKILTLVSLFIFLNKLFFIFILLFPVIIWIKNKLYLKRKFFPFFSVVFFSLWVIKNIFISGCAIYPVKITCIERLSWYSNNPKFIIAAENLSQFSELHAKNWSDIVDNEKYLNYENNIKKKKIFLKNFNWLTSSSTSENAKYGFLKIFNNYIFIIFIILIIYIFYNPKLPKRKKDTLNFNKRFILTVSIISTVILFYKFPLGRYGTSYFIILIYFLFYFLFKNKIKILDQKKIKKTFTYLVVFTGLIFLSKNVSKIALNFDVEYYQKPWPRIYENKDELKSLNAGSNNPINHNQILKDNLLKIYYINDLNYWTSDRSTTCMYNKSPCAQTSINFNQFKILKTKRDYYIIRLNKD